MTKEAALIRFRLVDCFIMVYSLIFCNKDEVIYSLNAALLTLYIVQTQQLFLPSLFSVASIASTGARISQIGSS